MKKEIMSYTADSETKDALTKYYNDYKTRLNDGSITVSEVQEDLIRLALYQKGYL